MPTYDEVAAVLDAIRLSHHLVHGPPRGIRACLEARVEIVVIEMLLGRRSLTAPVTITIGNIPYMTTLWCEYLYERAKACFPEDPNDQP